ncbi:unnamed protein product, partial [Prorocentrum cordatum]
IAPDDHRYSSQVEPAKLAHLAPRMRDVLDVAWAWRLKNGFPAEGFYSDPSQDIRRMPWSSDIKTFTRSSTIWDFHNARFLKKYDKLLLHGYPVNEMDFLGFDTGVNTWAGEGMFLPSIGSVLLGYFLNPRAPWWKEGPVQGTGAGETAA